MAGLPQIEQMLPHGKQCLNLDILTDWEPGQAASAEWWVKNERFGTYVNPLQMVEGLAQLSCIAAQTTVPESTDDIPRVLFLGIPFANFRTSAQAGQDLGLSVEVVERDRREFTFQGRVVNGHDQLVCEAGIKGMSIPRRIFDRMVADAQSEPDYKPFDPEELEEIQPDEFISHRHGGIMFDNMSGGQPTKIQNIPGAKNFIGHFPNGQEVLQGVQQAGIIGDSATSVYDSLRFASWISNGENPDVYPLGSSRAIGYRDVAFSSIIVPGQVLTVELAKAETKIEGLSAFDGTLKKSSGIVACTATVLIA